MNPLMFKWFFSTSFSVKICGPVVTLMKFIGLCRLSLASNVELEGAIVMPEFSSARSLRSFLSAIIRLTACCAVVPSTSLMLPQVSAR